MTLTIQKYFRNRIAGFIFGRYSLEDVAKKYMSKEESYLKGIEIIFWGEEIYLILVVLIVLNIFLAFLLSPFLLLAMAVYVPILILSATELELIILTNERVLIEKRTIIEKITGTQQFQGLALDQVALISYARAPPNYLLLIFAIFGVFVSLLPWLLIALNPIEGDLTLIGLITTLFLPPFLYLIWFGLRLTKRSIELFVIGLPASIGIGRIKGAPIWFLIEVQNNITERIHHLHHKKVAGDVELDLQEFPLQYSSLVIDLVKEAGDNIAKVLIMQLDQEALDIQEIYNNLPQYTTDHIDDELSYLKNKTIIIYNPEKNHWELNRNYKRTHLHEEVQKGL